MGKVGNSIVNLIPDLDLDKSLAFVNVRLPMANLSIAMEGEDLAVMAGDQTLFTATTLAECQDFLKGILVGGSLFSDLRLSGE
jgi:hypothetical protein